MGNVQHAATWRGNPIGPGTYRWESAVLQSSVVLERGVVLPASDIEIRGSN